MSKALGFAAIVAVAMAPVGVLLWRRRRPRRGGRALGGATKIRGLGATETSCGPGPGNVRVCLTRPKGAAKILKDPIDACKLLREAGRRDRESFYTIALGSRNNVLGIEEVARGTANEVEVHPREVMKGAIVMNAVGIVVAHNHPSGDPSPSDEDIQLTKRLIKVGRDVGIPVIDHLVVGDRRCTSIAESYGNLFRNQGDE